MARYSWILQTDERLYLTQRDWLIRGAAGNRISGGAVTTHS